MRTKVNGNTYIEIIDGKVTPVFHRSKIMETLVYIDNQEAIVLAPEVDFYEWLQEKLIELDVVHMEAESIQMNYYCNEREYTIFSDNGKIHHIRVIEKVI